MDTGADIGFSDDEKRAAGDRFIRKSEPDVGVDRDKTLIDKIEI